MAEIKTLLRASSVSNKDLTFAVGQTFSSDQQRSAKLKKKKKKKKDQEKMQFKMKDEAANELITSKQKKSVKRLIY